MATEQATTHGKQVLGDAFDLARDKGKLPESMRDTEIQVIAEGIIDECKNNRLGTEDELLAFVAWSIALYETSLPRAGWNPGAGDYSPSEAGQSEVGQSEARGAHG